MSDDETRVPAVVEDRPKRTDDPSQLDLFPYHQLIEVEKARIQSMDRRTDLGEKAIAASDSADKRQFEFQMEKLRIEEDAGKRHDRLALAVLVGGGALVTVLVFWLFAMAFYGSEGQIQTATKVLEVIGTAVGGGGAILLVFRLIRWLTRR